MMIITLDTLFFPPSKKIVDRNKIDLITGNFAFFEKHP